MKKIFLALSFLFLTTGIFLSQADSEANAATIITDQIIPYPDGSYWTNMCTFIANPLEYATAPKTVWCQKNWGPTNLVGGYVSLIEGQVAPGYIYRYQGILRPLNDGPIIAPTKTKPIETDVELEDS